MEDTEDEEFNSRRRLGEDPEQYIARLSAGGPPESLHEIVVFYSQRFHLSHRVAFLGLNIADAADDLTALRFCSVDSIAVASLYIASHILNEALSLAVVAQVTNYGQRSIHSAYRAIYYDRYRLIDANWLEVGGNTTLGEAAEALQSLPWPPLELEIVDREGDLDDSIDIQGDDEQSPPGGLDLVQELCYQFQAANDGSMDPINQIWIMANQVAQYMGGMTCDWKTTNPWTIAAACTYTASHLVFQGKSFEEVSTMSGIPPASIRNTYEVMYSEREQVVPTDFFVPFNWSRDHALDCLPKP